MKIAYLNMLRLDMKQADHMAAISVMLAINHKKRIVLMENDYGSNSLELAFRGIQRFYYVKDDMNYLHHRTGFDQLITEMPYRDHNDSILAKSAVELINNYLYYVPQSKVINHLAYEYELYFQMQYIIQSYEKLADYTMINTLGSKNNLNTKHILESADLVLVELTQNKDLVEAFFENYSSLRHKAIFLFSNYHKEQISISYIMKKYHLKKDRVAILGSHMPMYEACLKGGLIHFLKVNSNCGADSEHYKCIRELNRIGRLISKVERDDLIAKAVT